MAASQILCDGSVLLKIVQHCKDAVAEEARGKLLGEFAAEQVKVTNCFSIPPAEVKSGRFEETMLSCLKFVGTSDLTVVGWYCSASLSNFLTQEVLEAQFALQEENPNSVLLVCDPFHNNANKLDISAYRISESALQLFASGDFSQSSLAQAGVSSSSLLEQVPLKVVNSSLTHAFLFDLNRNNTTRSVASDRLHLSTHSFLEHNLQQLADCIDGYEREQGQLQFYQRQLARQQQQQQQFLAKQRADNDARRSAGQEPLPPPDLSKHPLFQPLPKPNRLESLLISKQIDFHCQQLINTANLGLSKLSVFEAQQ